MADGLEGFEASFAADEQVVLAIAAGPWSHDDGLFQADALDVADDLFEHAAVAFTRIQDLDAIERNHSQIRVTMFFILTHAALRMRMRRAMPYR